MLPGRDHNSLQIFRSVRAEEIGKNYSWKKKVCAVVLLFVTILIILHFVKLGNSTTQRIKRIKRHLNKSHFEIRQNIKNDIELVPENKKIYRHLNHRYEEGPKNNQKQLDPLKSRRRWAVPHSKPKRDKYPSNIEEVILKGKLSSPKANEQTELLNDILRGMRLKGVYVHPGTEGDLFGSQSNGVRYDLTEINNLMRNDSDNAGKRVLKKGFKSPGVPFKLPVKDPRRQTSTHRSKMLPITIYLDFHPMSSYGFSDEFKRRQPETNNIMPPKYNFRYSLPSQSDNVRKFLLPHESPKGIIMKLNLYPKQPAILERNEASRSKHNKRAEKKTFSLFTKHEDKQKKYHKDCSIMALKPHGKRITARWKNKKGEWIHADHVDVRYLKKEN